MKYKRNPTDKEFLKRIKISKEFGYNNFYNEIYVHYKIILGNLEIGDAFYVLGRDHISNVHIDPEYQRKGLATYLYDYIEQDQNIKLTSDASTKSAKAFWKNRIKNPMVFSYSNLRKWMYKNIPELINANISDITWKVTKFFDISKHQVRDVAYENISGYKWQLEEITFYKNIRPVIEIFSNKYRELLKKNKIERDREWRNFTIGDDFPKLSKIFNNSRFDGWWMGMDPAAFNITSVRAGRRSVIPWHEYRRALKNPMVPNLGNIRRWAYLNIPKHFYVDHLAKTYSKIFNRDQLTSEYIIAYSDDISLYRDVYIRINRKYGNSPLTKRLWREIMIEKPEKYFEYPHLESSIFRGKI